MVDKGGRTQEEAKSASLVKTESRLLLVRQGAELRCGSATRKFKGGGPGSKAGVVSVSQDPHETKLMRYIYVQRHYHSEIHKNSEFYLRHFFPRFSVKGTVSVT